MIRDTITLCCWPSVVRSRLVRVCVLVVALPMALGVAQPPPQKNSKPATPNPVACPVVGLSAPPIPQQPAGHHTVTLTWKANAPSTNRTRNAVGYCLYRRKTPGIPKKLSDCKDCELVNPAPVTGTGCVDDLVQDGVTYHYVVTAANEFSSISEASNEAPAPIPLTESPKAGPASSYPLCRVR